MAEEKRQEKKDEGKIIMATAMDCEDCRYKVYKTLEGYPGVEEVTINSNENKVTLKAPKVDPKKLFESVKKKSKGKITNLLYPDPLEIKKKEEARKEEKKPVEVTVVLKASMHCSSCTREVKKAAVQMNDVQNVKIEGKTLTIKGLDLDPNKVCAEITKKSGRNTEVVPLKKKDDEKKDGEKKEDNFKKNEKPTPQLAFEYVYPPQCFSDENPNACNIL